MTAPSPMRRYLYLGQPYSNNPEYSFTSALSAVAKLIAAGEMIFSPILHCHPIAVVHGLPGDARFWKQYNRTMLWHSGGLIVFKLPGWDKSSGLAAELRWAEEWGKPLAHLTPDLHYTPPSA